jgi:hypothetical protein
LMSSSPWRFQTSTASTYSSEYIHIVTICAVHILGCMVVAKLSVCAVDPGLPWINHSRFEHYSFIENLFPCFWVQPGEFQTKDWGHKNLMAGHSCHTGHTSNCCLKELDWEGRLKCLERRLPHFLLLFCMNCLNVLTGSLEQPWNQRRL